MRIALRAFGVILFLGGIAMVTYTFFAAAGLFFNPVGKSQALPELTKSFTATLARTLLLLVMALCGSIFASKGVQLYLAAGTKHGNPAE